MSLSSNHDFIPAVSFGQTAILYHYTYRHDAWLGSILRTGMILPNSPTQPVDRRVEPCPAVWFSRRSDYEPTALKPDGHGRLDTPEEYRRIGARIVVPADVAPIPWTLFRRTAAARFHLSRKVTAHAAVVRRHMEEYGRSLGADPADWFCTYEPVRDKLWLDVQVCDEAGRWISCGRQR